jgi:hypothetical protein
MGTNGFHVLVKLLDQTIGRFKTGNVTESVDEVNLQRLAVQVAGEVQQVNFYLGSATVLKGGAGADVDRRAEVWRLAGRGG